MSLSASSRTPRTLAPRVLVVDDDGLMRSLLHTVFTTAGFDVQLFTSGAELLASAELRTWALLLLDVKMPGMSGPELHRSLRERGCELPVIFLTGASDISIAVTAMHQGAVDFIEKPFSAQSLIERAHKALADPKRQMQWRSSTEFPALSDRLATLTPRESEVLALMVTGMASKTMARKLGASFRTIDIHRSRVMRKMAAANLAELVRMSIAAQVG